MIPFENDEPINDVLIALDLLYHEWSTRSDRVLRVTYDAEPSYIEIGWYCAGFTKEEHAKSFYFVVTARLVARLKDLKFVRGTPEWGRTDMHDLSITEKGGKHIEAVWNRVGGFDRWGRGDGGVPRAERWLARKYSA